MPSSLPHSSNCCIRKFPSSADPIHFLFWSSFGINLGDNLKTVQGRVLPSPRIMYAKQKDLQAKFGSWNMQTIAFSTPSTLKNWVWLFIDVPNSRHGLSPQGLAGSLDEFVQTLKNMGVAAEKPKGGTRIEYAFNADNAAAIEKAVRFLQEKHKPELILGILFAKDAQVYNTVKKVCDVRCGVRLVFRGRLDAWFVLCCNWMRPSRFATGHGLVLVGFFGFLCLDLAAAFVAAYWKVSFGCGSSEPRTYQSFPNFTSRFLTTE